MKNPPAPSGDPAQTGRLRCDADLAVAIAVLLQSDPVLIGRLLDATGMPRLRQRPANFAGLAAIIAAQQVSTASAAAMFGRLQARFDPLTSSGVLAAGAGALRACGLSAPKIRTLLAAAQAVEDGRLDFARLAIAAPDDARAELRRVSGVGPWTAEIVMLFCHGDADAWPNGDLALQEALGRLLGHPARLVPSGMEAAADRWRPNRGAAAHLLWAYYRTLPTRRPPASLDRADDPAQHSGG